MSREPAGSDPRRRPRRRLSQNFLHDGGVVRRIVEAVGPAPGERLLEIGPGRGALTGPLAASGARLDCVEVDRELAEELARRWRGDGRVTVHRQDILRFDPGLLAPAPGSLRVVGNLPYHISTPLLFHLLEHRALIRDMTFMLQLEVAQRLAARRGERGYGRLGLMVGYFCEVERLFNVPSAAFRPRPRVSSTVVRLAPHRNPPTRARDVNDLRAVLRAAFGQRRKTLRNSLKGVVPGRGLERLPLDLGLRPEKLSLADYVLISDALTELSREGGGAAEA